LFNKAFTICICFPRTNRLTEILAIKEAAFDILLIDAESSVRSLRGATLSHRCVSAPHTRCRFSFIAALFTFQHGTVSLAVPILRQTG